MVFCGYKFKAAVIASTGPEQEWAHQHSVMDRGLAQEDLLFPGKLLALIVAKRGRVTVFSCVASGELSIFQHTCPTHSHRHGLSYRLIGVV